MFKFRTIIFFILYGIFISVVGKLYAMDVDPQEEACTPRSLQRNRILPQSSLEGLPDDALLLIFSFFNQRDILL